MRARAVSSLAGARRELLIGGAMAAASFLAVSPLIRSYDVSGVAATLAAAAIASALIATATAGVFRTSTAASYPLSAAALLLVLFACSGLHPIGIAKAFVEGPNRLLTETQPLTGSRVSLAAPVVLTWLCAAAATELLLRARTRAGVATVGLAVPLLVFVLTYATSASAPGRDLFAGPLLLILLCSVAIAQFASAHRAMRSADAPDARESPRRQALWAPAISGVVTLVVTATVVGVLAPTLPGMSDKPASLSRAAPTLDRTVLDPLDAMAAYRDGSPQAQARPAFRLVVARPSTGYMAMAVLDHYDGAVWTFDATFHPTGLRIPETEPSLRASFDSSAVTQTVTLHTALPVVMLPALDRAISVNGLSIVADDATAMFLATGSGRAPVSYRVTSRAPQSTLTSLSAANGLGVSPADLALPSGASAAMATSLRFLVSIVGERPAANLAFLQAVVSGLHQDEKRIVPSPSQPTSGKPGKTPARQRTSTTVSSTVPTSVGGTSLSEVINAITVLHGATPEQFATFYAMVARYLGVPARVVSGFRIPPTSAGTPLASGAYEVTNKQAWAWVEIPVAGAGWVVVDPTPDAVIGAAKPPAQSVQASATTLPPRQANAVPSNQITGGHAVAKGSTVRLSTGFNLPTWLVLMIVLGGVCVLLLIAGPGLSALRRSSRRKARRSADSAELAVGAWLELLDGLDRAGMDTGPGSTSREVGVDAGAHFGPEFRPDVTRVGEIADMAVCSTTAPDAAASAWAWETQRSIGRTVLRNLDRRQRAKALIYVGRTPRGVFTTTGERTRE